MSDAIAANPKDRPLVSVVTPSYQAMPYIIRAIESVRVQDYLFMEHIIFDGGSTDGTLEVLQGYPELVWVSEPDRGQSDALNKGFRRAGGEIIGWLNADDTYQPGAIAAAVKFLVENPDVDLVYSDLRIIDETDELIGLTKSQPFQLEKLLLRNFIKQTTVFMRRRVLDLLGGVDEDLHYVMDREFWLRAGMAGFKMHYLENQTLANFRLIPGTKSYEHVPQFRAEWVHVLEKAFVLPALRHIPISVREDILRKTKAQYQWAFASMAMEKKDRKNFIFHFVQAVRKDPGLLTNRGTWLFIMKGMLGLKADRLRKFRKVSLNHLEL